MEHDESLLHRHPTWEKILKLDEGHVIVDRADWEEVRLILKLGEDLKSIKTRKHEVDENFELLSVRDLLPNFTLKGTLSRRIDNISIAQSDPYMESTTTLVNMEDVEHISVIKIVDNGKDS